MQEKFSAVAAENDFSGEVGDYEWIQAGWRPRRVSDVRPWFLILPSNLWPPITIPYPPFQRVPTTSMLPSQLLAIIGFFLMGSVHTFARDLSSSFFTHRFFPSTTFSTSGSRQLRRAFVPDSLSFPLGSASQPSWQVAEMGTMYRKRASSPKKAPTREQACQVEGDLCLFSNGLLGGAVKLPCCPTMSCVFTGKRFQCVADLDEEQDYTDIDLENFDNNEE